MWALDSAATKESSERLGLTKMSGTDTASPGRSEIDTIARKGNSVNSPMMIRGMWIRFRRTFIEVGTLRRATCPEGRGVNGGRWPERLSKGPPEEPSAAF